MARRFMVFLGPARIRVLFLLLAFTGLASLMLNVAEDASDWVTDAQTVLVLVFVFGSAVIVGTRLDAYDRGRMIGLLLPAFVAVVIGVLLLPDLSLLFVGLAVGWVVAGLFLFRPRGPMEYQQAVKLMRKSEYADAVKVMDGLIKEESENPNHYRFRAEILRLWGKLDRARRDYEKMAKIEPESAVAYNGLAEVLLQKQDYEAAQLAATRANELAPGEWVALYNLGMIEDRIGDSDAVVDHLESALTLKVPDARHRLLIHFYLVRAHVRLGNTEATLEQLQKLKRHSDGLEEWQTILASPQAGTLREVIGADIELANKLIAGEIDPTELVSAAQVAQ